MANAFVWIISLATIVCVLTRPRRIAEAWWASAGALLLILTGLIPLRLAGVAVLKGNDVYLFLAGMMILSELAREKGVFDWIAGEAAQHAGGSPRKLFLLIYLAGTIITALLSNDATAVVLTPAVLAIVRKVKATPAPYLLSCAFVANAASFLLPISNPANLVIFNGSMPRLHEWLGRFFLPSLASVVLTYVLLYTLTRSATRNHIATDLPKAALSLEGKLALAGLILGAGVLLSASALGWSLGLPTCAAALVALAIVTFHDHALPLKVARGVSWTVLPLVAGLFVLMEALQGAGMLTLVERGLDAASQLGQRGANLASAFAVALLSNGMNNLPVGLISGAAVQKSTHSGLANAVLVGVDLGPNLSVTGSLATILWLIALRREGVEITAWQFLKVGLVVMPLSLLGAVLLIW